MMNRRYLKSLIIILFLSVSTMTVVGCQQADEKRTDIDLSWEIEPNPPTVGIVNISIALKDSTDQPVEGAQMTLEGNMSHPGMQPVLVEAVESDPGSYTANMDINMAGDWYILVTTKLSDSTEVEHQINMGGVRPD